MMAPIQVRADPDGYVLVTIPLSLEASARVAIPGLYQPFFVEWAQGGIVLVTRAAEWQRGAGRFPRASPRGGRAAGGVPGGLARLPRRQSRSIQRRIISAASFSDPAPASGTNSSAIPTLCGLGSIVTRIARIPTAWAPPTSAARVSPTITHRSAGRRPRSSPKRKMARAGVVGGVGGPPQPEPPLPQGDKGVERVGVRLHHADLRLKEDPGGLVEEGIVPWPAQPLRRARHGVAGEQLAAGGVCLPPYPAAGPAGGPPPPPGGGDPA